MINRCFFLFLLSLVPFHLFSMDPATTSKGSGKKETNLLALSAHVIIPDQKELENVLKIYKRGLPIKGIPGLEKVHLSPKTLQHVFGAETKPQKKPCKTRVISGLHHDFNLEHISRFHYMSFSSTSNRLDDAFLAFDKEHLPVYKTFFPAYITKNDVIMLLIQSLKNVKTKEEQKDKWLLEGETSDGIKIRTVVNKNDGEIITFFPISSTPEEEIKAKTEDLQKKWIKLFLNPEGKPTRKPITPGEITKLLKPFSRGINFNMTLSEVNLVSPAMQRLLPIIIPCWVPALINKHRIVSLMKKYPGRIKLIKNIKKLHLTQATLDKVFSENDESFPPYLTRVEILNLLKEALNNPYSKMKQHLQINNKRTEKDLNFPSFRKESDKTISFRGRTKNLDEDKNFTFYIVINSKTRKIEDFHMLFD